jgi:hypothetical protein
MSFSGVEFLHVCLLTADRIIEKCCSRTSTRLLNRRMTSDEVLNTLDVAVDYLIQ